MMDFCESQIDGRIAPAKFAKCSRTEVQYITFILQFMRADPIVERQGFAQLFEGGVDGFEMDARVVIFEESSQFTSDKEYIWGVEV